MSVDMCLELRENGLPGHYAVRVLSAPAGGQSHGTLNLDVDRIQGSLRDVESTVLASSVSARRVVPQSEQVLQAMGSELFAAAFPRDVYGTYRASLASAAQSGERLRVVLSFAAPQLAALPWELMFDPGLGTYVCRSEPLLRTIPAEDYHRRPLRITPPLRILGIVASPRGLPQLDVEAEKQHLAEALSDYVESGQIELVWTEEATWDEVHELLLDGPWHAVHFIGHGDYDALSESGLVVFNGPDGRPHRVTADQLVDLLSTADPTPRLVFLNSCNSGRSGDEDLFSSTSAALVRGGISAVVAMQFAVSDAGAIAFSRGFYKALAAGRAVDEATRNGRIAMRGRSDTSLEWVTPVLCVRGGATELFALGRRPRRAARQAAEPAAPRRPRPVVAQEEEPAHAAGPQPVPGGAGREEEPPGAHDAGAVPFAGTVPFAAAAPESLPLSPPARRLRVGDDAGGLAMSADGALIAVGRRRGVTLIETASGAVVRELRTEDGRDFSRVALSGSTDRVAAGSWFGSLAVWNASTGTQLMAASAGASVDGLAFASQGRLVVGSLESMSREAQRTLVTTWDATTGARGRVARQQDLDEPNDALALSADGAWLAEADPQGVVEVHGTETGDLAGRIHAPGPVRVLAVSGGGERVAAGSADFGLCVWSLAGPAPRLDVVRSGDVGHLAFNGTGSQLAASCVDGRLLVLDPDSGRIWVAVECRDRVRALALAADCSSLAALEDDGTVTLWHLAASTSS